MMPRTHAPYPPEFCHQMVELVRTGRPIRDVARDFECHDQTNRNWIRQADLDDGLTTDERDELRRENRQLRLEREILAKPRPGLLGRPARYPQSNRVQESESGPLPHCQGAPSARRDRELPPRQQYDAVLKTCISNIHHHSRGTYGAPRIQAELAADGIHIGRKRVAKLLQEMSLARVSRRKGTRTTRRDHGLRPAPDLVERRFEADAPDRLWVADLGRIPVSGGRGRRLQPAGRGLAGGQSPAHRPGAGSAQRGAVATPSRQRRPAQRSRQPAYVVRLRQTLPRDASCAVHGVRRRLF